MKPLNSKKTTSWKLAGALLATGLFAQSAQALTYEYPTVYKDVRVLSMGGANVAVGGGNSAVFTNPAGLTRMDQGVTVDLLPLNIVLGQNISDFASDMIDVSDMPSNTQAEEDAKEEAYLQVMKDYRGKNIHFGFDSHTAVGWRGNNRWMPENDNLAISIGALASVTSNFRTHQGYGSDGLLEVDARTLAGGVFGAAYQRDDIHVGAAVKVLSMGRLNEAYTTTDIMDISDETRNFDDDLQTASAVGLDAGVMYDYMPDSALRPTFGVSILNIGGMDFGDAGEIPMTVNVGASIRPQGNFANGYFNDKVTFAFDYVDLLNGYEQDSDIMKRTRVGGELLVWNHTLSSLALRAGLYQGQYTAGFDLRLAVVSIGFATYAEEVGAYAGQDPDRRFLATFRINW